MIQVSPSLLESFRLVLSEDAKHSFATPEMLREYILGEYKPNEATSRGTALHMMLENGPMAYAKEGSQVGPNNDFVCEVWEPELGKRWTFDGLTTALCIEVRAKIEGAAFEVQARRNMAVMGHPVSIYGKVDVAHNGGIHEFKTSKYKAKRAKYFDSLQWRLYLFMTGAEFVTYHHFYFAKPWTAKYAASRAKKGVFQITCEYTSFTFYKSDYDRAEFEPYLHKFVNWVSHNPDCYQRLEEKFSNSLKYGNINLL